MEFALGWITGLICIGIGYAMGLIHAGLWKKEKKEETKKPGIYDNLVFKGTPITQGELLDQTEISLGAVRRPEPEDIEKKEKPLIKDEEDAWGEEIGKMPGAGQIWK